MRLDLKMTNVLNAVNQEAKHFCLYYFSDSGFIIPHKESDIAMGAHFMRLPQSLRIEELYGTFESKLGNSVVVYSSQEVYDILKVAKKRDMKALTKTDHLSLDLNDGTKNPIGFFDKYGECVNSIGKKHSSAMHICKYNHDSARKLTDHEVSSIGSRYAVLKVGEFNIRISKKLFPNFKVTDQINVFCKRNDDDRFTAVFELEKISGIITYHGYEFINY